MKIKIPFMPVDVDVKSFGNEEIAKIERAPFKTYRDQLLSQESRQTDTTKAVAVTTYERDLLLHLKASHTYFQLYRRFDGLMAQSFCGGLTQYEKVTLETVLKKTYHVRLLDVVCSHMPQDIDIKEGQFLRMYRYEDQWIYVIMENL